MDGCPVGESVVDDVEKINDCGDMLGASEVTLEVGATVGGELVGANSRDLLGVSVATLEFGATVGAELVGATAGYLLGVSVATGGSKFSQDGAKHASVKKHMYSNLPFASFAQSHTKESNISPQQVSVDPSVHCEPSSKHAAPTPHVAMPASTDGAAEEYAMNGAGVGESEEGAKVSVSLSFDEASSTKS